MTKLKLSGIWGKLGFFRFISVVRLVFWLKNGCWYVSLWALGNIDKKKHQKMTKKETKMSKNSEKSVKISKSSQKSAKNHVFNAILGSAQMSL